MVNLTSVIKPPLVNTPNSCVGAVGSLVFVLWKQWGLDVVAQWHSSLWSAVLLLQDQILRPFRLKKKDIYMGVIVNSNKYIQQKNMFFFVDPIILN